MTNFEKIKQMSVESAGVHSLEEGMKVKMLRPLSKTNVGGLL